MKRKYSIIVVLLGASIALQVLIMMRQSGFLDGTVPAVPETVWAAPDATLIDVSDMPFEGPSDASIVIIEFTDYECPFCEQHATTVLRQLRESLIEPGAIRYVLANHPLSIHPSAEALASAAICAGEQGRYWEMHDKLFDSRPTTPDEAFILVDSLNIDRDRFETCIAGPTPEEIISRDLSLASSLGLTATPSFAVGTVASDNQVTIKTFIRGAQPFAVFEEAIAGL